MNQNINIVFKNSIDLDYYYDEFKLVRTNIKNTSESEYLPGIEGAESLVISEDNGTVVMDKGYDANDEFIAKKIQQDELGDETPICFTYEGKNREVSMLSSYGSKAVFVEDGTRLFIKKFKFEQ